MYEINTYYKNLNRIEKIIFKERIMNDLGINYATFYVWLSRNTIPKHFREKYIETLSKPLELINVA